MTVRHMISFPLGTQRFNYRVAAVIVVDGHVLVTREDDDPYVMLPGGRVEIGEPSALSLKREILEELGMDGEVGRLLMTSESFYDRVGEEFHEISLFYAATLPDAARPNGASPWLIRHDEGHELSFYWVPLAGDGLEAINLLPGWLPARLRDLPAGLTHVVYDVREAPR